MVLFEESSPPVPAESVLNPSPRLHLFDSVPSLQDMYHLSNPVDFLPCNFIVPPLEKYTSTPFVWLSPKTDSTEEFYFFDECFFYSELPSISPNVHMSIHSPSVCDITLLQIDLLPIIFDTSASLSIYPFKLDFVVPITPLP